MERPHYRKVLERTGVLQVLAAFDPHAVGTPPLGRDLPTSDIDIVCFAPDPLAFARAVSNAFGLCPDFRIFQRIQPDRAVVAKFVHSDWMIEIFG